MNESQKSPPKPLTAPPAPDLDWSRGGAPASRMFDDIYFSVDGGLAETKAVFLQACGLPQRWQGRDVFVIAELGFGSGLNFLAALNLWKQTAKPEQMLHFFSVEAFPWAAEDLKKALAQWPDLAHEAHELITQWPGQVKGVHRLHFGNASLTLLHEDCELALTGIDTGVAVDAWFLDGFTPAKNPDMWSPSVFNHMARLSNHGAIASTFTVAGNVRNGLSEAGFKVEKQAGFGRKRERLEAVYTGAKQITSTQKTAPRTDSVYSRPVIIGGGIAGASIAKALEQRGISPIIIEPDAGLSTAASGNPAGLVMPKLDLQDRPESRFYLSAYLYSLARYEQSGGIISRGIFNAAKSQAEAARFEKLAAQNALPARHVQNVPSSSDDTKWPAPHGGHFYPRALTIAPKDVINNWTKTSTYIRAHVHGVNSEDNVHHVHSENGKIIASTKTLFICAGANILNLTDVAVRFTRGQICWGPSENPPPTSMIYGGYCAPFSDDILLGASHDHVGPGEDVSIDKGVTAQLAQLYTNFSGQKISHKSWDARTAVRVTSRDTLPIAQNLGGAYVLSALGSRGLMLAPLLGEALVCSALGEPSPLDVRTAARFISKPKASYG